LNHCNFVYSFFPIWASDSADKLLYFEEDRDLLKLSYVQC